MKSSSHPVEPRSKVPYFVDVETERPEQSVTSVTKVASDDARSASSRAVTTNEDRTPSKAAKAKGAGHKEGILSPVVVAAKSLLGDEKLNKIRADVISMHSDAIKSFVATSDSPFGRAALVRLFSMADRNGDGRLDEKELRYALRTLGFSWLQEKQVNGILQRADLDKSGKIEFDEFMKEAPKTLKTNLVKLAKKNGGEMGLLV